MLLAFVCADIPPLLQIGTPVSTCYEVMEIKKMKIIILLKKKKKYFVRGVMRKELKINNSI